MQDENVRNALVVLSSTDDVEFQGWKSIGNRMTQLYSCLDTMKEKKELYNNERKNLAEAFEGTLSKQESKKKSLLQEFAEYQAKLAETEKHLERSRAQLKLLQEKSDQQMKQKEMLMIFNENNDFENERDFISAEAEFVQTALCIRWATDKEQHEIEGFQGLIEPHKQKMFKFDKREKSSYYICNKLWEMMEPNEDWSDLYTKPTKYHADKDFALTYSVNSDHSDESAACSSTNPNL